MPADMEEDGSSFLTTTDAIEQDLDLSNSDQGAAQAVAAGLRDAKAANTRRAPTHPHGTRSVTGPSSSDGRPCPQLPRT